MKKILAVALALMALSALSVAQDRDTVLVGTVYKDTLTLAHDTVDVSIRSDELGVDIYSVQAYAISGTDTINVFVAAPDGRFAQVGLTDMASLAEVTQIIVTTVPKRFELPVSSASKFRFVCPDAGAAQCSFTFFAEKTNFPR